MAIILTPAQRLEEAEHQYHLLVTGQAAKVFVDQNGERVEYAVANAARLAQYIQTLKNSLDANAPTGPMQMWI